jgi:four helix bundle protein
MTFADEIQKRLYDLSQEIFRLCETLPHTDAAREVAGQIRRSSSGASANYRASGRARSRREWIGKLGTVVEEIDETDHWLAAIVDRGFQNVSQNLRSECRELRAILAKSYATARRRTSPKR